MVDTKVTLTVVFSTHCPRGSETSSLSVTKVLECLVTWFGGGGVVSLSKTGVLNLCTVGCCESLVEPTGSFSEDNVPYFSIDNARVIYTKKV